FDVTDRWAEDRTKLALITVDESGMRAEQHSFWDLKQQSDRFVNVLKGLGVSKGDR
ncbi:MAG TPA: acyl-CoA synthetase, partial [Dehalococcoidia bacterium]|nr:acyl-CoA synthetase [Dehalococcoidia bacterium]